MNSLKYLLEGNPVVQKSATWFLQRALQNLMCPFPPSLFNPCSRCHW